MGAKQLVYADDARKKLLTGVSKLARAVRCTLGPRGRNAVVQIAAGREGERLWMQVRDNGGGLQVRTLKALRTGVGLSNTRARLDCLYGRHYRLEFSDKNGGLSVLIEIPFQRVTSAGSPAAFRVA